MSWGESAGGEEHAQPVVVAVAITASESSVQFDDSIHGLGAAVRWSGGGEVGQERVPPTTQSPTEPRDLGDRTGAECVDDLLRDPPPSTGELHL